MYFTDDPITKLKDDLFDRKTFVNGLARDINNWVGKSSLVVALYGPWGSGKSSVLNLLQMRLAHYKKCQTISFDPWYFNSTEQLIQTFLTIVKNKVMPYATKDKDRKQKLEDAFTKYGIVLSFEPEINVSIFKFKLGKAEANKRESENPETVRNTLKQLLTSIPEKFIILIDNLDRLDPPELMLMFKLVRLCSDFPNFIFVLAFDHRQVQELITQQNIDSDFIAKIIQLDIELPLIDQDEIDRFVITSIQLIINNLRLDIKQKTWDRYENIYYQVISSLLINDLRKAKRYLNSIMFTIPLVRENVDLADFLVLEAIRVFYPKIYSGLPLYRKELTTFEYGIDPLRNQRLAELHKFQEWIVKELSEEKGTHICEVLIGFLFPPIGAYFQNTSNPSIITRQDEYLANQRICIPEFFDMYFKFRLPKGEISTTILEEIEDTLNKNEEISAEQVVALILSEKQRLSQLLRKFYFRINSINLVGRTILITSLGKMGNVLEWELLNSWNSSGSTAIRLIIKCTERFENDPSIQRAIVEVISTTPSLSFASELISKLFSDDRLPQIGQNERAFLQSLMIDRLHKEVLEKNENIFSSYPTSYYWILNAWRSEKILNKKEIATKYVYDQLPLDSNVLPKLLILYITFYGGTDHVEQFEFKKLKEDYDLNILFLTLKKQEPSAIYSSIEQQAINAFKKFMEN